MGPKPTGADEWLLRAAAASHRRWFEFAEGGSRLVDPGVAVEDLVEKARRPAPERFGVWSLGPDDDLGVRLVARGFEWGWRPRWMGIELDREPPRPERFEVVPAAPPFARTLPYRDDASPPPEAVHLGVRLREKLVGQVVVLPGEDGVAGIYATGVVPKVRRRGIGTDLMRAALRAAWERGCEAAVLNSTEEGEPLYRRVGFRSLGWGQTWWSISGAEPSERQIAIAEAVGLGDLAAIATLAPCEDEVGGRFADSGATDVATAARRGTEDPDGPEDGALPAAADPVAPVVLAVIAGRVDSLEFLLDRFPALAARRLGADGGNLLHLAVQYDRPEIVQLALRRGVDRDARDKTYDATPAGWAEHFSSLELRRLVS